MQPLRQVASNGACLQTRSAQADVAVGTQEIERRLRDLRTRQLGVIDRIGGKHMDAQQFAETRG